MKSKKVTILGAGPSGLSAAINLAHAGYNVRVFERSDDCGTRFGGDLQGLENWTEKQNVIDDMRNMGLEINFDADPVSRVSGTNGHYVKEMNLPKPIFYLVKRGTVEGSLDQGLKKQALENGVEIHFNQTRAEDEVDIVATGPKDKTMAVADTGIVFKTSMPDMAIGLVNDKAAYKGYGYLLITKGYGCMCTVVYKDTKNLMHYYDETKKIFGRLFDLDIQNPQKVGGRGNFSTKNVFQKGNTLYVGEAAKLQDALWGFGIRFAITSGYLAAQSIIEGVHYETLARARFMHKLKASVVNRFIWELGNFKHRSLLFEIGLRVRDPFKMLYSTHNYPLWQRVLYPVAATFGKMKYPGLKV